MFSAPTLTATTNGFGLNSSAVSEFAPLAMHLAIRCRVTTPTAMGRTQSFNFLMQLVLHYIEWMHRIREADPCWLR